MRRQQHAVEPAERRIGGERLHSEDVDRRSADPLLPDGGGERRVVHQLAARGVDQHRRRLHQPQPLGIDQVAGLVGERDVQRHHIGRPEQVVEREEPDLEVGRPLGEEIGIVRHDVHAEGARQLRDVPADPAESHDADGLAPQLGSLEPFAVPFALPHRGRGLGDAPYQGEQQPHRVLPGAHRVGARSVHHRDTAPRRGVHVDRVHARAGPCDDAQVRRPRQQIGGDPGFAPHDQRMGPRERPLQLLTGLSRDAHQLDLRRRREEVEAALRDLIRDDDAPGHPTGLPAVAAPTRRSGEAARPGRPRCGRPCDRCESWSP